MLLGVVLAACSGSASPAATQPRYQLYADNVSGPPITIQIGGRTVATVPCAGGAQLTAGADGVPALPWSLDVRRANGALLRHEELTASRFSNGFLMMLLQGRNLPPSRTSLLVRMDRLASWETKPVGALARVSEIEQETAFARLIDRHLDDACRLATVIFGGDRMEAEDAVQEAAVRAWRHFGDLRDEERFAAWFTRIVVNACRDRLRSQRVHVIDPAALDTAVPDHSRSIDETDALVQAIRALPADQRIVVALRYFDDCSLEEIAARTGERTGTVKSRLHYGLRALRAALDADAREVSR